MNRANRIFRHLGLTLAVLLCLTRPVCAQASTGGGEVSDSSSSLLHGLIGPRQLSNTPDDIGYQLSESDESIDAIFRNAPLDPLHTFWDRTNQHLKESCRLDLGLNYTAVYQRSDTTVSGSKNAGGGDLDLFGRWHLTGTEDRWPGSLVFNSENRHRMASVAPSRLNTGTVGGTVVGFGQQDLALVQFYWEQGSVDDGVVVRVGKMDSALIFDGGRYVSSNYAFLSPAFSDTQPMALPGAGLGLAAGLYPTDSTYIAAGIHDANGKRTTTGFDTFFGQGEYFTAIEAGWYPNEGKRNEGLYHLTLWNIDARTTARRPSDRGIALTMEQQIGNRGMLVPFFRYAHSRRGLNGIRQNLSTGIGIEDVLGQNFDLIGAAFSWQEPADRSLRDQFVIESFYRILITPHTHLTPDIQVVVDPARAPTKKAVTVFGLRVRTLY